MYGSFLIDKNDPEIQAIMNRLALPGLDTQIKGGAISPTDTVLVLEREGGKIRPLPMAWGFPRWQAEGVVYETAVETIHKEPLLRNCLLSRPVVVPTSGFFVPGANGTEQHLFREPGKSVLYLAGFAGTFPVHNNRAPDLFVLLSTAANESVAPYGERMPITLHREEIETWISGDELKLFLERKPFALEAARG